MLGHDKDEAMMPGLRRPLCTVLCGLGLSLAALPALAADSDGNYAVRGVGATTCGDFATAVEQQDQNLPLVLQWLQGYVSGLNLLQEGTYDASPIQEPGTLAALVLNVCRSNDGLILETATAQALNALAPARLTQQSENLTLEAADRQVVVRRDTLRQVQRRLRETGHYTSSIDGLYGPGTRRALASYQESAGLTVTELPDADTLIRLLVQE